MIKIESRYPQMSAAEAEGQGLAKITVRLKGKLPTSVHALCDMLDAAAERAAQAKGAVLKASGAHRTSKTGTLSRTYFVKA